MTTTVFATGPFQAQAHQGAGGLMFTTLIQQASIKACGDVFACCAIAAFCIVPITFLSRASKAGGGAAPPAH